MQKKLQNELGRILSETFFRTKKMNINKPDICIGVYQFKEDLMPFQALRKSSFKSAKVFVLREIFFQQEQHF